MRQYAPGAALYVCGGGARNQELLGAIARLVAPNPVASTDMLGLDPDYVESVAFAWYARRTLASMTSSAGSVTGVRGARILGGVALREPRLAPAAAIMELSPGSAQTCPYE